MRTKSAVAAQLEQARGAVTVLEACGHLVHGVQVDAWGSSPTIKITPSPAHPLRGTPTREQRADGTTDDHYTATLDGCRLQWRM